MSFAPSLSLLADVTETSRKARILAGSRLAKRENLSIARPILIVTIETFMLQMGPRSSSIVITPDATDHSWPLVERTTTAITFATIIKRILPSREGPKKMMMSNGKRCRNNGSRSAPPVQSSGGDARNV